MIKCDADGRKCWSLSNQRLVIGRRLILPTNPSMKSLYRSKRSLTSLLPLMSQNDQITQDEADAPNAKPEVNISMTVIKCDVT